MLGGEKANGTLFLVIFLLIIAFLLLPIVHWKDTQAYVQQLN